MKNALFTLFQFSIEISVSRTFGHCASVYKKTESLEISKFFNLHGFFIIYYNNKKTLVCLSLATKSTWGTFSTYKSIYMEYISTHSIMITNTYLWPAVNTKWTKN